MGHYTIFIVILIAIDASLANAQFQETSFGVGYYSAISKNVSVGRVNCARLALRSGLGDSTFWYGSLIVDFPITQPTPLLAFHVGVADRLYRNLNLRINTGFGQFKLLNKPAPAGFEETHLYLGLSLESDILRPCFVEAGIQQRLLIPYLGALQAADLFCVLWIRI